MNGPAKYPTGEQLKEIIQGPSDVEWRCVSAGTTAPSQIMLAIADYCRYEMRRECQEIIPGLLLGPFLVSRSLERLKSLGVTHM